MKNKLSIKILVILMLGSMFQCKQSNKSIQILSQEGNVYLKDKNSFEEEKIYQKDTEHPSIRNLSLGQTLLTKKNSIVILEDKTKTKYLVLPNSQISFQVDSESKNLIVTITEGEVFIHKPINLQEDDIKQMLIIATHSKAMISQSDFFITTNQEKDTYSILSGRIKIQRNQFNNETMISDFDQQTIIEKNKEPLILVLSQKMKSKILNFKNKLLIQ